MEDLSENELRDLFHKCATEWTSRFKENPRMLAVQFPYGQIRGLQEICSRWHYLPYEKRRKLGCAIQLCDVNSWFLNTWKVSLTAGAEWEWQCTLPVVAVMEMLLHSYGTEIGIIPETTLFKKSINKFHNASIIGNQLRSELHIHRERRNDIHLFLKSYVGNHDDKPARYNQCVRTLKKLEQVIHDHWHNNNA
jgi:hypothetical protein